MLNLADALVLVHDWEAKFKDGKFCAGYLDQQENEIEEARQMRIRKLKHIPKFNPEMAELFLGSRALMFPELLPHMPMRTLMNNTATGPYLRSEEYLLALGLEQFLPFHQSRKRKFAFKKMILMDAVQSIVEHLMPTRWPKGLHSHLMRRRVMCDGNPINHYFKMGYVPSRIHCVALDNIARAPNEQPRASLPIVWQDIARELEASISFFGILSQCIAYLFHSIQFHITIH